MAAGIANRLRSTKARSATTHILGIDPGLDRTGYAIIESDNSQKSHVVDAGVIRTDAKWQLADRLAEIERELCALLDEHSVSLVAVEDLYSHYQHPRTAILMGHARGVILLAASRKSIPVLSLPATNIKKMLTGNGHAGKLQMQRAIVSTFRLRSMPEPHDVADAMAIAWCAGMCRRNS
jgi:crossover junction endodeoxyribonuclease RuvC